MSRPSFAIAAILALSAAAAGCAPQCTCPATIPAPVGTPPDAAAPSIPAPSGTPQQPTTIAGPLRILNEDDAEAEMRSLHPRHLADAGVGADVLVDVVLGSNGLVESASDVRVSNDAFRGPALTVAHRLQFVGTLPAQGTPVRVRMRWRTTSTSLEIVQP